MNDIENASCLDAFSGSGALGFESISRGAKHCVFLEKNKVAAKALKDNRDALGVKNADIIQTDTAYASEKLR